jgi:hypothetical protein
MADQHTAKTRVYSGLWRTRAARTHVDEAFGVNPAHRMLSDTKPAGAIGDDDGDFEQALGLDRTPERSFAGATRYSRQHVYGSGP